MTTSTLARLERLEVAFGGGGRCGECFDWPVRIVTVDVDIEGNTDELVSESMPAEGCPSCGRPVYREIQIIGVDIDDLP